MESQNVGVPREGRIVVVGAAHHVTQRGNDRQAIFFCRDDRQAYLDRMFEYCHQYRLRVLAYCLMPNHIHVVGTPETEGSLARVFGRLQADYARAVNFRRRRIGHLWQERFYSCPMEECHTLEALAYVERNPVRAGMVTSAGEYAWSSARVHLRGSDPLGRLDLDPWRRYHTPERWAEVLATSVRDAAWEQRFREATLHGRPFGSEGYVGWVAEQKRLSLVRRRRGRPRKPPPAVAGG